MVRYTGLLIHIWRVGNKLLMQGGFLEDSMGDILPTSRFLIGLYTFCAFVNYIFFNVSLDDM